MKIAVPKERREHETRVALSPEVVEKIISQGHTVTVEKGAGTYSSMTDLAYHIAGAQLAENYAETVKAAELVIKVQPPFAPGKGSVDEIFPLPEGCILLGILAPYVHQDLFSSYKKKNDLLLS